MARLGKEELYVRSKEDRDIFMRVDFIIYVNVEGYFTTTLKPEDVDLIESFGINLYSNGRANGKTGYFANKTKEGLVNEVKEVLEQCIARKMVKEEIVIKYAFCTVASFALTLNGDIIPNPGWHLDGKVNQDLYWQKGTLVNHATDPHPIGVQMYVKPFFKRTYEYKNGKTKVDYVEFTPFGGTQTDEGQYYLHWLEQICSTTPPRHGKVIEIEYTEDRAKFFVTMFKSLCKLANTIKKFSEPETLIKLIEEGKYLMQ